MRRRPEYWLAILGFVVVALTVVFTAGCEYRPQGDVETGSGRAVTIIGIYETGEPFPALASYRTDKSFHDALKARGHTWRFVDQHVKGTDGQPPRDVAPFIADAQGKTLPRVYLNDTQTGKSLYAGSLSKDDPAAFLSLLDQYDGNRNGPSLRR